MELRQLRYVVSVAEELHFGRAAAKEHVAQSAVSEQIRRLERELGTELFRRTSRHVELTEAGRLFVDEVKSTLVQLNNAAELATRAARGEFGDLRVGFVATGANDLTPRILQRFRQVMPAVQVELRDSSLDDPTAGLADGSTDVAFVRLPLRELPWLRTEELLVEPSMLAVPTDHRFASRETVAVDELPAEEMVHLRGASPLDPRTPMNPVANTIAEALERVAVSAISIVPASYSRYYARPGVAFVRLSGGPRSRIALAWRGQAKRRAVETFVEAARDVVRSVPRRQDLAPSSEVMDLRTTVTEDSATA